MDSKLIQPLLTTAILGGTTTTLPHPIIGSSSTPYETTEESFYDDISESSTKVFEHFTTEEILLASSSSSSRTHRSLNVLTNVLKPGICLKGCNTVFWIFTIVSMVLNWFGSSGRIGNILVNYRAVATEDKSFAQGLMLMMISLFGLIPGPIIFGRIIDSTCLKWTKTCTGNGNCQLYDQEAFRVTINSVACCKFPSEIIF